MLFFSACMATFILNQSLYDLYRFILLEPDTFEFDVVDDKFVWLDVVEDDTMWVSRVV